MIGWGRPEAAGWWTRQAARSRVYGTVAALLALALLAGNASPGFPLAALAGTVTRGLGSQLRARIDAHGGAPTLPALDGSLGAALGASQQGLDDIPARYLALYVKAARTCPRLTWAVLAGIGKVETDHGRSGEAGVSSGVNSFGCCSGPMQFNIRNGPPSTWDAYGDGVLVHVYDPTYAIPAAARLLCANGLAGQVPSDPCPGMAGSAGLHTAIWHYNHACWYVQRVLGYATRYTRPAGGQPSAAPGKPAGGQASVAGPSHDPFVMALAHNRRIGTTSGAGCDPAPDLASGKLDLRLQSLLAAIAERYSVRLSCLRSGHSTYVAGTTRVSNHTVWRAVDIDRVDGQPVSPASARARALVVWLDGLDGPLRPGEIGSPFDLGHRPYFSDESHQDHVHIGYSAM